MKCLIAILLLSSFPLAAAQVRLTVNLTDVDSLRLAASLPGLLAQVRTQLAEVDRPEALRRQWRLLRAFYGFQAVRQEIGLAQEKLTTLATLHELNDRLAAKAEITDVELLQSRNAVISQRIAVLTKTEECRMRLLEILELVNAEIVSDGKETPIAAGPERPRE